MRSPATRAVSGGGHRPESSSRGPHGRRPHDRAQFEVTSRTRTPSVTELRDQRVQPEGILLKPNMVLPVMSARSRPPTTRCAQRPCGASYATSLRPCPGIGLSLRRPVGRGGAPQDERYERARPAPVEAVVLLRRALQAAALKAWAARRRTSRQPARLLPPGEDDSAAQTGPTPRHGAGGGPA